jgi:hypothetical protein
VRAAVRMLVVCLVLASSCDGGGPADTVSPTVPAPEAASVRLERSPRWLGPYCGKAVADLGYGVLCPRRLPHPIEIIPCVGPSPEEELWGEYCFDFVLDVLFRGPPGYQGSLAPNARTGHLAIWTIGPESDFYPDGLFACPGGGRRGRPDRLAGYDGAWWTCPADAAANLNSGHVAFQWAAGQIVHGASVHGSRESDRELVRRLVEVSVW